MPFIAAAGLAAASLGISVVWPLLMADVNNEATHPALAIGGVTAAGYLGMVAGPPIVGIVSGAFGRPTGLMVLAAIALFVAVTPAHVRTASAKRRDGQMRMRSASPFASHHRRGRPTPEPGISYGSRMLRSWRRSSALRAAVPETFTNRAAVSAVITG